ncbi:MAG: NAD(P)H-dependent oxidoreductase subunit E [Planctomycetes bacterium]|nr:NAD(P)H-dependent oxidoreductase subunit E [Planctomycetota bacterium]
MQTIEAGKIEELREFIATILKSDYGDSNLISVLHKTQELFGYLPREVMDEIAQRMSLPTAHIWGVATFYHYFNLTAPGKYVISICLGTACYVKGAAEILTVIEQELGIKVGETTEDKLFSLQPARCLGACGLAPVVMINDKIYGDLTTVKIKKLIMDFRKSEQHK